MLLTKSITILAMLLKVTLAAPEPEVVSASDLEDRNRDRRGCVAGAGGNVCMNGPYRKCYYYMESRKAKKLPIKCD